MFDLGATLAICAVALVTEAMLGYPPWLFAAIGHPVTWIGAAIAWLDRRFNRATDAFATRRKKGAAALLGLLVLCTGIAVLFQTILITLLPLAVAILCFGIVASTCLAQRSLHAHVAAVADALEREGIDSARRAVGAIVGRDTAALDEAAIARAAIESLAENFADGIVAPAFWIALFGLPGGVLYKAINTADSMIAHRTPRHEAFGYAAAKIDDAANFVPARLAALWIVCAGLPTGRASDAWRVMRRDARGHPSPNAGWPEAAMAGALGLRLGGPRAYAGEIVPDAFIGDGARVPDASAIRAALRLYRIACGLQIALVLALVLLILR